MMPIFNNPTYGCQNFPVWRLCRFDRRAADTGCTGCQRVTDSDYLIEHGLWAIGVSHAQPVIVGLRTEIKMFEETQEQLEFHRKLEMWCGQVDRKPTALNWIEGVRLQGEHICLELIGDDGYEAEWAISLAELVKMHGDFIKYSHPTDAEENKAEVLKALRDAIAAIELQHSEPEAWFKATK